MTRPSVLPQRPNNTPNKNNVPVHFSPLQLSSESDELARQIRPLLYSITDGAQRLGVSERTLWRLVEEQKVYPTYVHARWSQKRNFSATSGNRLCGLMRGKSQLQLGNLQNRMNTLSLSRRTMMQWRKHPKYP